MAIKKHHLHWDTDDEFQEYYDAGEEGLLKGIRGYRHEKGYKLSTYLFTCISNELFKIIQKNNSIKRRNIYGKDISLNQKMEKDNLDDKEYIDLIQADINIEEEYEKKQIYKRMMYEVECFSNKKYSDVIIKFYGLRGKSKSLKQLAEEYGCSTGAIAEIKKRALERLKKRMRDIC